MTVLSPATALIFYNCPTAHCKTNIIYASIIMSSVDHTCQNGWTSEHITKSLQTSELISTPSDGVSYQFIITGKEVMQWHIYYRGPCLNHAGMPGGQRHNITVRDAGRDAGTVTTRRGGVQGGPGVRTPPSRRQDDLWDSRKSDVFEVLCMGGG